MTLCHFDIGVNMERKGTVGDGCEMKMLCRFCETEFEFKGDNQALAKETIDHIREKHPEKAREMGIKLFNLMKEYYIVQRG